MTKLYVRWDDDGLQAATPAEIVAALRADEKLRAEVLGEFTRASAAAASDAIERFRKERARAEAAEAKVVELERECQRLRGQLETMTAAVKRVIYKSPLHCGLPDTADLTAADLDELFNLLKANEQPIQPTPKSPAPLIPVGTCVGCGGKNAALFDGSYCCKLCRERHVQTSPHPQVAEASAMPRETMCPEPDCSGAAGHEGAHHPISSPSVDSAREDERSDRGDLACRERELAKARAHISALETLAHAAIAIRTRLDGDIGLMSAEEQQELLAFDAAVKEAGL